MDGFAVADDVASAVAAVGCVAFRGAFSGELQPAKAPAPIAMIAVRGTYFLRIFLRDYSVSRLLACLSFFLLFLCTITGG